MHVAGDKAMHRYTFKKNMRPKLLPCCKRLADNAAHHPRTMSTRALLRAYQRLQSEEEPEWGPRRDLDLLQAKDLDLSVRLGALLAFDALLVTVATNPISASPGAPLSLDAPTQPIAVALITLSVIILSIAAYLCVRAIMIGEEFSDEGMRG